jgi:predicted permease
MARAAMRHWVTRAAHTFWNDGPVQTVLCYHRAIVPADLLDALRVLARDRWFSGLAVVLLASTTGVTLAVWLIIGQTLWAPLPMADAARTVVIWQVDAARATPIVEVGLGEAEEWAGPDSPLTSVAVFSSVNAPVAIVTGESRARATSSWVSAHFFDVAGTRPQVGRVLQPADDLGGQPRVAVISDGYWTRVFGRDPAVVGRTVLIQRSVTATPQPVEIVGVMPRGFDFPGGVDYWLPAAPMLRSIAAGVPGDRTEVEDWYLTHYRVFYALGRLRSGATSAMAAERIGPIVRAQKSSAGTPSSVNVTAVWDYLAGPAKPLLWTMLAGSLLMVLLACSSVAGLHLYRAAYRDRALAVQLALGAGRVRLIRQALAESALVGSAGALLALVVAWTITRLLLRWAPLPTADVAIDLATPTVTAAAVLLAGVTTVLTGVWPAMFVSRIDPGRVLAAGTRSAAHPRERRTQRFIVASQVAVAVVLLTGAALFIRSVRTLDRTPLGFEPDNLVAIDLQPSSTDLAQWDGFFDSLLERIASLPTVRAAGAMAQRPLNGPIGSDTIPVLKGQEGLGPDAPWRANPRVNLQVVSPTYFAAVGTRLLAGRHFTAADTADALNVVIVGAATADRLWPGRDPVGEPILVATQRRPGGLETPRWQTVVGVVEDARHRGIVDPRLDVYLPAAQSTIRLRDLMVRTAGPPERVVGDIQAMARTLDAGVLTGEVAVLTETVAREKAPWRFAMRILTGFGALAAMLSVVGLIGLLSLVITLRRRELAIRAALGASPARLRGDVLAEASRIVIPASIIGALIAAGLARLVTNLLVEVAPHDPAALAGAMAVAVILSASAALWPARRAVTSDPAAALRE